MISQTELHNEKLLDKINKIDTTQLTLELNVVFLQNIDLFEHLSKKFKLDFAYNFPSQIALQSFIVSEQSKFELYYVRKEKITPAGIPSGFVNSIKLRDVKTCEPMIVFVRDFDKIVRGYFQILQETWMHLSTHIKNDTTRKLIRELIS